MKRVGAADGDRAKTQMITKNEKMEMQNLFDAQPKEHAYTSILRDNFSLFLIRICCNQNCLKFFNS